MALTCYVGKNLKIILFKKNFPPHPPTLMPIPPHPPLSPPPQVRAKRAETKRVRPGPLALALHQQDHDHDHDDDHHGQDDDDYVASICQAVFGMCGFLIISDMTSQNQILKMTTFLQCF